MGRTVKAGQLLVNSVLPESMRDYGRVLDSKGLNQLLSQLATSEPDKYREITHKLLNISSRAATGSGGFSFSSADMARSAIASKYKQQLEARMHDILANDDLTDEQRNAQLIEATAQIQKAQTDAIFEEAVKARNPLASQALSGARGSRKNLAALLAGDMLYEDSQGQTLPVPIIESFSEGVTPASYLAGTYGARKAIINTKLCLSADTSVRMADFSTRKIVDIRPGDWVLGADHDGRTYPVRVVRVYDNGLRRCYNHVFSVGRSRSRTIDVTCTDDHKILLRVNGNFRGLVVDAIRWADRKYVSAVLAKEYIGGTGEEQPLALLAGLMLGDGCMAPSTHGSYQFSCADKLLITDIATYLRIFGLELKHYGRYSYGLVSTERLPFKRKANGQILEGHTSPAKAWLKETLGEKLAHQKIIPDVVHTWDNASVAALIGGMFSTDGCVHYVGKINHVGINFFNTSKPLVDQLKMLLETRFGIWCSETKFVDKTRKAHAVNDLYGFSVSGQESVLRFIRYIPLVGIKKRLLKVLQGNVKLPANHKHLTCKMKSKKEVGLIPTFDLEVDSESHLFVLANGLIVSNSTAHAGYYGKLLNQIAHRLVVTADDEDEELDDDGLPVAKAVRGLPVDVDDSDNEGALLAADTGGYRRNTVLTPKILRDLKQQGLKRLLVRSPVAMGSPDGGVYAYDLGVRNGSRLPGIGSIVGMEAAQSASEPVSQSSLGSKHSGGVVGQSNAVGSFDRLNSMIQVPKIFPGGAAHAELDGTVQRVTPAPAGGSYVFINDQQHFVPPGRGLKVKPGDSIEAGDVISEGYPNPSVVVRHKGLGEGRRYWASAMRDIMKEAGMRANRRNFELLAAGLINHVKLDDEVDGWAPDDVVPYHLIASRYKPREDATETEPVRAIGQYLEKPVLHYSIGTRIRPSVQKTLQEFGVKSVVAHREPPPFTPHMIRAADNLQHDPDWMTQMYGSGLKGSLLDSAHTGAVSDEAGTSFVPSLARSSGFGTYGKIQKPQLGLPQSLVSGSKLAGDINATPNRSTMNTTPSTGHVSGGMASSQTSAQHGHFNVGKGLEPVQAAKPLPDARTRENLSKPVELNGDWGSERENTFGGARPSQTLAAPSQPNYQVPSYSYQPSYSQQPSYAAPSAPAAVSEPPPQTGTAPAAPASPGSVLGLAGDTAVGLGGLATQLYGQSRGLQMASAPRMPGALQAGRSLLRGTGYSGLMGGVADATTQLATTGQIDPAQLANVTAENALAVPIHHQLSKVMPRAGFLTRMPLVSVGLDAGKNLLGLSTRQERQQSVQNRAQMLQELADPNASMGSRLLAGAGTVLSALSPTLISDAREAVDSTVDLMNAQRAAIQTGQTAGMDTSRRLEKLRATETDPERLRKRHQMELATQAAKELSQYTAESSWLANGSASQAAQQRLEKNVDDRAKLRYSLQTNTDEHGNPLSPEQYHALELSLVDLNRQIREDRASLRKMW